MRPRSLLAALPPDGRTAVLFLLRHLAAGVLAAGGFTLAILAGDLFGLRSLLLADERGWIAGALLFFGLSVTFGSAAMGAAVMGLGRERDE